MPKQFTLGQAGSLAAIKHPGLKTAAGGGGGASLITLDSFSAAATATGWDSLAPVITYGSGGRYGTVAQVHLKDDEEVFSWRSSVDDKLKSASVTFDGSGDPTYGTEQDLTDFTTSSVSPIWLDRVSNTSVLITQAVNTDPQKFEIAEYDISSGTFTIADGVQTITMSSGTYPYNHEGFGIHVISADEAIATVNDYHYDTTGATRAYSIKFTATQSIRAAVDLTGSMANTDQSNTMWGDPTHAYQTTMFSLNGNGIDELALDGSTPPIISYDTDHGAGAGQPYAASGTSQVGGKAPLCQPDAPAEAGEAFFLTLEAGIFHWSGPTANDHTMYGHVAGITDTSADFPVHNNTAAINLDSRLTYIDKSGDTHRFILVSATTAKIRAVAVNIDTVAKKMTFGPTLVTTNITKHGNGYLFGVARPKAGASKLTIIVQDDATTVKGLTLTYTT